MTRQRLSERVARRHRGVELGAESLEQRLNFATTLGLTGPSSPVVEGDKAVFTLTLSQPVSRAVPVIVTTASGTATNGIDYAAPARAQVLIPAGQLSQTFAIPTLRDVGTPKTEGPETFTVYATPTDSSLGSRSLVVGIADLVAPLPSVTVLGPAQGVAEGQPAVFTVRLSAAPGDRVVTLTYATGAVTDTAAAGTDYTAVSGQLRFTGSQTTQTVLVPTLKDAAIDQNETFSLTVKTATNATVATPTAVATIIDSNVPLPVIACAAPAASVVEGYDAVFTVSLSHAPGATPVSVFYATANDTALAGIDYTATSGTLRFVGTEISKTVVVKTRTDRVVEAGGEAFTLTLSSPIGGTIGTASGTATIVDPPSIVIPPAPAGTYSPQQIRAAYSLNYGGDGAGTTIAIVVAGGSNTVRQDLNAFNTYYGLPAPPFFQIVNQTGGSVIPAPIPAWQGEIALDVQWAHAVAPGAGILLVCANSATTADLFAAVDYARNVPGVSVVSMSWGAAESPATPADIALYDDVLTTPSGHVGVTFVAAAGDDGEVSYPASSSRVLAVGGTRLTIGPSGGYGSEQVWNDFTTTGLATGGGPSAYVPKPDFQNGVNTGPGGTTGTTRGTPDVSFSARDVPVYVGGAWQTVSGTSFSTPAWAGLIAIANGRRLAQGKGTLTNTLEAIYAQPARNFHDITRGNNGSYPALPGYDLASGRGTPIGSLVIADLINSGGVSTAVTPSGRVSSLATIVAGSATTGMTSSSPTVRTAPLVARPAASPAVAAVRPAASAVAPEAFRQLARPKPLPAWAVVRSPVPVAAGLESLARR